MADRIRVLVAIGSLDGGGSERQALNILKHLDRSRFEPHLYLVHRRGEFLDAIPDDVVITAFSDQPAPAGFYVPGRLRQLQIRHLVETLRNTGVDAVYDRTPPMTLLTAPACSRAGVPRLSTIVSDPFRDLHENIPRFRRVKQWLLRRAYRSADRVIVNSESLREPCRQIYGLDPERLVTVVNGFDFAAIAELADNPPDPGVTPIAEGSFRLISAGRLHPQKGFADLIRAVGLLQAEPDVPRTVLSIIGRGPEEPALARLIGQLGLEDSVQLAGFQENPYPVMAHADLFCLTSLCEGMPNVLVEAMSLGTPVLATDCLYGPREILQEGELGTLVSPGQPEAIAAGIREAITKPEKIRSRAEAAKRSVLQRYDISSSIRKLESVIAEAVKTPVL